MWKVIWILYLFFKIFDDVIFGFIIYDINVEFLRLIGGRLKLNKMIFLFVNGIKCWC